MDYIYESKIGKMSFLSVLILFCLISGCAKIASRTPLDGTIPLPNSGGNMNFVSVFAYSAAPQTIKKGEPTFTIYATEEAMTEPEIQQPCTSDAARRLIQSYMISFGLYNMNGLDTNTGLPIRELYKVNQGDGLLTWDFIQVYLGVKRKREEVGGFGEIKFTKLPMNDNDTFEVNLNLVNGAYTTNQTLSGKVYRYVKPACN